MPCECVELWRVRVQLWRLRYIYDEKLDLTTDFAYFCGCIGTTDFAYLTTLSECYNNVDVCVPLWLTEPRDKHMRQEFVISYPALAICVPLFS